MTSLLDIVGCAYSFNLHVVFVFAGDATATAHGGWNGKRATAATRIQSRSPGANDAYRHRNGSANEIRERRTHAQSYATTYAAVG